MQSPVLAGLQGVRDTVRIAGNRNANDRTVVVAVAGIAGGLAAYNTVDALTLGGGNIGKNVLDSANVSVSFGRSTSKSTSSTRDDTNVASQIARSAEPMNEEPRVNYEEMRCVVMESVYNYCSSLHESHKADQIQYIYKLNVFGSTFDGEPVLFDRPIEQLMWATLALILVITPDNQKMVEVYGQQVRSIIAEHGLESLIAEIPPQEAQQLVGNLSSLDLV